MGMFDSFLGKGGGGYTEAQRTGLARSAEIKKKRKEEERAFTKSQEEAKGKLALKERSMMEAGATRRTGMGVAGDIEEQRMANVGQMTRQKLVGEQGVEAATTEAIREAETFSVKRGHEISLAEIEAGGKPGKWISTKDKLGFDVVFNPDTGETKYPGATTGERARSSLGGTKKKKSSWSDFDY